ncbi:hypothetical protein C1701_19090 [Actinoalloteichus sp. AHMU CJ021]|uniref:Uncharacterized protein n=1 Tax=Actinoalloteichus caeruleus DSM 43889 TaxID=1120930 RepID=A0ABT1JPW3_ACTCY|nr:hypothetical protein [Actinoalloteichus caeruleus]AUS80093.1 hypothetical protein C1701_19090 [Actinoalloteichus sp. AHMU CJ021]MCP2334294.1 hypothetical protein [Actinoalloteichus caeruleus DSM 43889]
MPTQQQTRALLAAGHDYERAGRALRVPPGLAYLIATGEPADGDHTEPPPTAVRLGLTRSRSQRLVNALEHTPDSHDEVRWWTAHRVLSDPDQRRHAS